MTKFAIRKFSAQKHNNLHSPQQRRINLTNSGLRMLLTGLIIFAGLSYLFYMNQTATSGFDIKGMENSIEQIKKINKSLELQTAELQSLQRIEAASQELQMVATTRIEYLPAVGASVAVK